MTTGYENGRKEEILVTSFSYSCLSVTVFQ